MFLSMESLNDQMATMEKMARVSLYQIWFPFEMGFQEPSRPGFYLVTKEQNTGERQVAFGHWSGSEWSGNGNFTNVVAYIPVPDPWGGEEDD